MFIFNLLPPSIIGCKMGHTYYVYSSGTDFKGQEFETRLEAEQAMWEYCLKQGIKSLECTECDKHERKYSNHKGVRFYINRI